MILYAVLCQSSEDVKLNLEGHFLDMTLSYVRNLLQDTGFQL